MGGIRGSFRGRRGEPLVQPDLDRLNLDTDPERRLQPMWSENSTFYPYHDIEGRQDFGVPIPGSIGQAGRDQTKNQDIYNALLGMGYPTRERVQELMAATGRLRNANLSPRVNPANRMGQQQGGERPEAYLAAKDRLLGSEAM